MIRLTDDIVLNPNLSKTLIDFLRALEYHINTDGVCWPSRERIAAVMRCSVRSVSRCIREALELKLIAVVRRRRRSNVYQLLCGKVYPQASLDVPPRRHAEQTTSFLKERSGNGFKKKPWKEVALIRDDISELMGPDLAQQNRGWFTRIAQLAPYETVQDALRTVRQAILEQEVGGPMVHSPSGLLTHLLRKAGAPI